ncbi:phosphatidylglycerophosphatase A [Oceaniovalibus guishaninsula JLT2003]|uniref:Phosphatidylglycerophosphatase A n=1 Tax=Oceaniovalibus guishaninsula JLT2003 TaxID=1231392 RepID=K2GLI4_9RHOB|nr:phosphatidylglycerophosphatase A [Oceaniovalibus guishaninsula]EKE43586.1 phosphatidylglycerophosphatase A [Oceaniovalibus guishaninsula JLT2003]
MTRFIATFAYVGLLRPGPGTWGSLAALPVAWALHVAGGPWLLIAAALALFALGYWATLRETARTGAEDPGEIVVDEVVGQWVALLPLSFGAARMGADILALWPGWIAAFALFRLFDIWKPGPVGWADRRHDAAGVMLDDVVAGLLAAICVVVLAGIAHGVLMA